MIVVNISLCRLDDDDGDHGGLLLMSMLLLKKSDYELGMSEENITNFTKTSFLGRRREG